MAELIFKCLHLTVDNIKQSIKYYEKLGFRIIDAESTRNTSSVYLCLSKDLAKPGDFTICLTMVFGKQITTAIPPPFSLEFAAEVNLDHEDGDLFQDIFQQLSDKGIVYKNASVLEMKKVVVGVGMMSDPDGNSLQIVDDFQDNY